MATLIMDMKQYAPIIIPTFSRYKHFRRCVESLSRCTGAQYTDLYVGVDFTDDDKYKEGNKKIREFCKSISGFNNVFVIYREQNFGAIKNMQDLRLRVETAGHRAYILTEDDNEFSPNFLEYMNLCLVKYETEPNVFAICGHSYPTWENLGNYTHNAFPLKGYCAWGCGFWFSKNKGLSVFDKADKLIYSWKNVIKMFAHNHFITVHRMMFRYRNAGGDLRKRFYLVLKNQYCIFPAVSKVRNHGFDGSGQNCVTITKFEKQKIDCSETFVLDDFEIQNYSNLKRIYNIEYGGNLIFKILTVLEYIMFRLTGKCFRNFDQIRALQRMKVRYNNKKLQ